MYIEGQTGLHCTALATPFLKDHVNKLGETGLPVNIDKVTVDSGFCVKHFVLIGRDKPDLE